MGSAINLVSLMDIFTILVFFLLVNSSDGELLPTHKSVHLPESIAEEKPRETLVVMITGSDILIHGTVIASTDRPARKKPGAPHWYCKPHWRNRHAGFSVHRHAQIRRSCAKPPSWVTGRFPTDC